MSEILNLNSLPNIDSESLQKVDDDRLFNASRNEHKPRILVLYGSLRECSFSRLAAEEASRLLEYFGTEVRTFNPSGLPLPDDADVEHPKV